VKDKAVRDKLSSLFSFKVDDEYEKGFLTLSASPQEFGAIFR